MRYINKRRLVPYSGSCTKQSGATMVEVMISVLIFSVGLLGIASTQTLGLTNTQSALNRSYAAQLSYEMLDLMRLNRATTQLTDFAAGNIFDTFATTLGNASTQPERTDCGKAAQQCSATNLAENDLFLWEQKVENKPC